MSPAGRPELFPIKKVIGFDQKMVDAIDAWRRRQSDVPTFSDAVRRLLAKGLARKPA
jgi:hypothetical protein